MWSRSPAPIRVSAADVSLRVVPPGSAAALVTGDPVLDRVIGLSTPTPHLLRATLDAATRRALASWVASLLDEGAAPSPPPLAVPAQPLDALAHIIASDPCEAVRLECAACLGALDPAHPGLQHAASDVDPRVRAVAAWATGDAAALAALCDPRVHPSPVVLGAVRALATLHDGPALADGLAAAALARDLRVLAATLDAAPQLAPDLATARIATAARGILAHPPRSRAARQHLGDRLLALLPVHPSPDLRRATIALADPDALARLLGAITPAEGHLLAARRRALPRWHPARRRLGRLLRDAVVHTPDGSLTTTHAGGLSPPRRHGALSAPPPDGRHTPSAPCDD